MTLVRLDYIWLDGYQPTANIRTKAQVIDADLFDGDIESVPEWGFDGSSTRQAEGHDSDCVLQPVRLYENPMREDSHIVLCEVFNADGSVPASNTRASLGDDTDEFWFGFEQEYVLMTTDDRPLGFPIGGYPEPQGPYYCAVGSHNVAGRDIIEEHWDICLAAGVPSQDFKNVGSIENVLNMDLSISKV